MPRALLLLLPLLAVTRLSRSADVFVIADTANQTITIADAAKETIEEANDIALATNDTVTDSDDDHEPVVRKKRTFGDVVFRGLADVLGYNVARKPPQIAFPPPLAPVPGIDAPIQAIPVAVYPVIAAAPVAAPAPAPAPAAAPCGAPRAVGPLPCRAQAPPPPPPKPTQPPCPRPRANPRPKPKPAPKPRPPPPPPCARPRANPTTPSPCAPAPPPPPPPKADPNLETITSNFRLDFNFNRAQATPAPAQDEEEQEQEVEQEQFAPVEIQPRAAQLPLEPPRSPRVYLDAFVVRNGVAQKVHAVDAKNLNRNQANQDDDYLVYDEEEQPQQHQDDEYEYVEESRDRAKAVREFGNAVDRFWEKKQKKPKKKRPANDYRNVHFGDRDLVNQIREQSNEKLQNLRKAQPNSNRIPLPLPEAEDEDEVTTTTQDPRRRLKPRVLPPTEQNPNQIDTVTVRVPPIYKEKRPKKLHRERPERPDRDEEEEAEEVQEPSEQEYSSDSDTENSYTVSQTEKPKRKRRRKQKRRTRSTYEPYTAGDYDYYGKKLPISDEEKYFRGLTIPPPTRDADLIRSEEGKSGEGHFLDDHERLRDDPERIKTNKRNYDRERTDDKERADESERSDDSERSYKEEERTGENERTGDNERSNDETERTDKLSPNAKVRETNYQNNYVRATNVQVDDPRPLVSTVKKKTTTIGKA